MCDENRRAPQIWGTVPGKDFLIARIKICTKTNNIPPPSDAPSGSVSLQHPRKSECALQRLLVLGSSYALLGLRTSPG